MTRDLVGIPAGITIDEAIDDYFMAFDFTAFPVVDGDDTTGILTLRAVREVPGDERSETRVVDVMEPLADHCVVEVDDELGDVVGKLMGGDIRRVVVVDDGTVVGLISSRDLVRWLERSRDLGREEASLRLTPDQGPRDTAS
jgi:predicted transcriptional regulator